MNHPHPDPDPADAWGPASRGEVLPGPYPGHAPSWREARSICLQGSAWNGALPVADPPVRHERPKAAQGGAP